MIGPHVAFFVTYLVNLYSEHATKSLTKEENAS